MNNKIHLIRATIFIFGFVAGCLIDIYNKQPIDFGNNVWAGIGLLFAYVLLVEDND